MRHFRKIVCVSLSLWLMTANSYAFAFSKKASNAKKITSKFGAYAKLNFPVCDLNSSTLSPGAMQLAQQLNLIPLFNRLSTLRAEIQSYKSGKVPSELRQDMRDVKEEIIEIIEQTRLEVDFVQSMLSVEVAIQDELLHAYTEDRDKRMNTNYDWAFRTNGVLWAVAEGLDIPTYKHSHLSIPSGSIGIIAGLVPSMFSMMAVRENSGGHYDREARPNMLSKIFNCPCPSNMDYPKSVWNYLNSVPPESTDTESRLDRLISRWINDPHMHSLSDKNCKEELDALTGAKRHRVTIQLVTDRLAMFRQVGVLISLMNRSLLEIMMVVREQKNCIE